MSVDSAVILTRTLSMEMKLHNRQCFTVALFLMLSLVACKEDAATPAGKTAKSSHFTMTLSGDHVDGEFVVDVPADRITGIVYDSNMTLLYLRVAEADSKVLSMTLSVDGVAVSTGSYNFGDGKATMSLGDVGFEQGTSMEAESGTLTLTAYDEATRKAAGTVDGQFRSTNYKEKVYNVKGSFLVNL